MRSGGRTNARCASGGIGPETPRERERWHALWLLAQGWSEAQVARALERDAHTIGAWVNAFGAAGPRSLAFEQTGGSPPALDAAAQAALKAAVQQPPWEAGIEPANWKVVREFIKRRFDQGRCRSSCLNYLHRLGFVLRRPKKRLTKADAAKREEFVRLYAEVRQEAERGPKGAPASIWFVDEAFFRADADLRGLWVLKGRSALVDSRSPSLEEKVVSLSAVCLETGEVEKMEVEGTCTTEASVAFLRQLRANHPEALIVIWDNGPAHRGDALRTSPATPDLRVRLTPLPGYSPDDNADGAIWDCVREDVTANTCLGTKAKVRENVSAFLQGLSARRDGVKQRCRTILQAQADALSQATAGSLSPPDHGVPALALIYTSDV